ncbi:ChaN family lipoprotein [Limibaculum sp. M0105]|uniref:ChaN family lipoprotein n=1 Tax=Thermohalobaculum xanthum TaxID=2753746 RepID=A0A8J7SEG8_9RHOB|nr:ChaN family lipoprotein [Thermohalobaculum xanthum]MBK0400652.1 ChaN family lipoprotein [Thermohalobaculum xanthum]
MTVGFDMIGPGISGALRALAVALGLAACAPLGAPPGPVGPDALTGRIWDVAAGREIAPDILAARLRGADLVILGEVHDNPTHHARQAWAVEAIDPAGLAFEMVPEASEEGIAVFRAQGAAPGEIGPAIGWDRLGWPDWPLYAQIFEAAPDAYVAGGGVARADLRLASAEGAAAAYGAGAASAGLEAPLPAAQQAEAEAEMVAAHCNQLPPEYAAAMVESQRLRDARFAAALLRAYRQGEGRGAAVLITGNGHARTDRGVPVYLAARAPGLDVISVGQVEVAEGAAPPAPGDPSFPFDYVWFSEPAARTDPCAGFTMR